MNTVNETTINLADFIAEFKDVLLDSVNNSNPPVYSETKINLHRKQIMDSLKRCPFAAQQAVVQAVTALLIDKGEKAAIINAEMGTGKTMMAIATASVLASEGYKRHLVLSPPHLVYKWRREILETLPNAKVWILNGPDTLAKLIELKQTLAIQQTDAIEFYILGRVRMRMGYHWKMVCHEKLILQEQAFKAVCCPGCFSPMQDTNGLFMTKSQFLELDKQTTCLKCGSKLWTLTRPGSISLTTTERAIQALSKLPTIGKVTAKKIVSQFGDDFILTTLADNLYEFVNLLDDKGEFFFNDKQAQRLERALSKIEFGFGEGGYQPTEFIKRYLPKNYFDSLIVDEGHEYKNQSSAQGLAMGVLASQVKKILLLTGTLMGGYADDLFFLLFRVLTKRMIEDGYQPRDNGSLGFAAMRFLEHHGILKEIYSEKTTGQHKTAKGSRIAKRTVKAPGFGPKGIYRYVLPYTVFLKLSQIGGNVLPTYKEHFLNVPMDDIQQQSYQNFSIKLLCELNKALALKDTTLMEVVLNALLAWPDCCFRDETIYHPRTNTILASTPSLFDEQEIMPKEQTLLELCLQEKGQQRKVLVYTTYTGKRDTCTRLKTILESKGLNVAILRVSVSTDKREEWIADKVEQGIDVLITNPELVKTGLDLLSFPTIAFMQTGFNVYTLLQASRRSWRIGQTEPVNVYFLGYENTAQIGCLTLMSKKIAVSQSTSGDMPDSGLDILNSDGDSVEMALAKQLID